MNVEQAPAWLPTFLVPFFTLSYPIPTPREPDSFPTSSYYHDGLLDACFVVTAIAVMAVLRDVTRVWLAEPFARWKLKRDLRKSKDRKAARAAAANGGGTPTSRASDAEKMPLLKTTNMTAQERRAMRHSVLRFAEQSWSLVYYIVQWSFGMYVHTQLPTQMSDLRHLWLNYPHTPLAAPVKIYYLTQAAFYTHQMLVLNAEARRKDHWQMMLHHVITVSLLVISYFYYYTRIGCLILVIMDWCDIWLVLAKMLKYLNYTTICDVLFTFFMVSWLWTRHMLFILVIRSALYEAPKILEYGWDPERGYYHSQPVHTACCVLLVILQIIQIVWFGMIARVAYRVVVGQGADDSRSDDEMDDSEDEVPKKER